MIRWRPSGPSGLPKGDHDHDHPVRTVKFFLVEFERRNVEYRIFIVIVTRVLCRFRVYRLRVVFFVTLERGAEIAVGRL